MNEEIKGTDIDRVHERANHEDILHVRRLSLFLTFNGFLAVAVGFLDDNWPKIIFAFVALLFNVLWGFWAPNVRKFIRALRDAGRDRADERLWRKTVGESETKYRWFKDPLTIASYVPWLLSVGWILILIYYGFLF